MMGKSRVLKKEDKQYIQTRAKWELRLHLLKAIESFKAEDKNFKKFSEKDIIAVLSSMILKKCE